MLPKPTPDPPRPQRQNDGDGLKGRPVGTLAGVRDAGPSSASSSSSAPIEQSSDTTRRSRSLRSPQTPRVRRPLRRRTRGQPAPAPNIARPRLGSSAPRAGEHVPCSPRKPRLWGSRPKVAPPRECRSPADGYLPATRAVDRKTAAAGSAAPRLSIRSARPRARADLIAADLGGRDCSPPHAGGDEEHLGGVMMGGMHARPSGAPTRSQSRRRASRQRRSRVRTVSSLERGLGRASGWSRCCLSWWRNLTPSLRNALRRW